MDYNVEESEVVRGVNKKWRFGITTIPFFTMKVMNTLPPQQKTPTAIPKRVKMWLSLFKLIHTAESPVKKEIGFFHGK